MHWAAPTSQYPAPQEAGHGIRGGGRDAAAVGMTTPLAALAPPGFGLPALCSLRP